MPEIYVKEFSEIAVTAGQPKITKLRKQKNKGPYEPAGDYYKALREAIIQAHELGTGADCIDQAVEDCLNPKRQPNYKSLAKSYLKWWGTKSISAHPHRKMVHSENGLDIVINPELCLEWSGKRRLIKLFFNKDGMTQTRANYIIHLMNLKCGKGLECNVLDIKKSKLYSFTGSTANFELGVTAESAFISSIWPNL